MKAYLYGAAVVAFLAMLAGAYYKGGVDCRSSAATALAEHRAKETRLLEEVQKAKDKREVVYRDRIKIVEGSKDACMDAHLPDDVRVLLNGGNKAK